MFDVQQHNSTSPFQTSGQQLSSAQPYFKVKQEDSGPPAPPQVGDYESPGGGGGHVHQICPDLLNNNNNNNTNTADSRMLETQSRSNFSKSCSHEPTVCSHNPEPPTGTMTYNSPSCDGHSTAGAPGNQGHNIGSSHSPTSCFYDNCPTTSSGGSTAVDSGGFQGSVLAHLPFSGSQQGHTSNVGTGNGGYDRSGSKDYSSWNKEHSWPNQNQYYRANSGSYTSAAEQQKSSCMMRENYDNINSPLNNMQSGSSTPSDRSYRTSLSHMTYPPPSENPMTNLRSHTPSGSQTPHQQYGMQSGAVSSQQQSYSHPSFNTSPDVKPYSYQMQNVRQPMAPPPSLTPPNPYSQSQSMSPIHPAAQPTQVPPANMNHHLHNHPPGMPRWEAMGLPTNPDGIPVGMMNPEMNPQAMTEYQYQQQQMFYARDNRRPRRIACTCPNCRDGENKTVTTKDGKQRKLHVCHIPGCGKIYGKTSHLRAHLRWHAGERPFACNWLFCNKRFTRSDELQRHRRTHTGDKRFECTICLKKFMRSDHLSKHMKTHQSHNKQTGKDKTDAAGAADKTKQTAAAVVAATANNNNNNNNNINNNNNNITMVNNNNKIKTDPVVPQGLHPEEAQKTGNTMGIAESMKL